MAKFYGTVGYIRNEKVKPGVYKPTPIERKYSGEVLKRSYKWQTGDKVNSDISVENRISIVSDDFARENYGYIRYVIWMGTKWKVTSIEVNYPRLILSIGDIYNDN